MLKTGDNMTTRNKVKRAFSIDENVEERLTKLSKQGISRSFFANKAIRRSLKNLGFW
jgi:hypothetical protein